MNGGDRVAGVLQAHRVRFLFTLCGGHISPILKGAKDAGIRVIDVRHEATAVFAADAVARLTGVPGVAAVTAGPGVTNTITAVKNAQLAQSPLVLIGGAAATALRGRGALQDIDQIALFRPHVKWAHRVTRLADLVPVLYKAFHIARDGVPGPVFVECPVDLLYEAPVVREWYEASMPRGTSLADRAVRGYLGYHVKRLLAEPREKPATAPHQPRTPAPSSAAVARSIRQLVKCQRPLLVVGSQALVEAGDADAVADAIECLGIPVYLSGMARGLLGRAHPLHRRHARRKALKAADLVIQAGVPSDFRLDYGRHVRSSACLIAANRSRVDLKRNRRPTIGALCDAGLFLRALAKSLPGDTHKKWHEWDATLAERDALREQEIEASAAVSGEFINPVALCKAIDAEQTGNSIIIADGGDFVGTASYIVRPGKPLAWLDPGVFGTLGCGAGFALGASLCYPEHQVWAIFGDGAVGYSLAEFDTFVRHQIPVLAVVGNDASWAQIAREQVKMLGDDVGTTLARSHYHKVATALGGHGIILQHAEQTAVRLEEARHVVASGQPVLLNAWLDRTDFREGSLSM